MSSRLSGNISKWKGQELNCCDFLSEKYSHLTVRKNCKFDRDLQMEVLNSSHFVLAFDVNRNIKEIRIGPETLCLISPDTQSWY